MTQSNNPRSVQARRLMEGEGFLEIEHHAPNVPIISDWYHPPQGVFLLVTQKT